MRRNESLTGSGKGNPTTESPRYFQGGAVRSPNATMKMDDNRFTRVLHFAKHVRNKNDNDDFEKVNQEGDKLWKKLIQDLRKLDRGNGKLTAPRLEDYFVTEPTHNNPGLNDVKKIKEFKIEHKFNYEAWAKNLLAYYIFDAFLRNWVNGNPKAKLNSDYHEQTSFLHLLKDFIDRQDTSAETITDAELERRKEYATLFTSNDSVGWDVKKQYQDYIQEHNKHQIERRKQVEKYQDEENKEKTRRATSALNDRYKNWLTYSSKRYPKEKYKDWLKEKDKEIAERKDREKKDAVAEKKSKNYQKDIYNTALKEYQEKLSKAQTSEDREYYQRNIEYTKEKLKNLEDSEADKIGEEQKRKRYEEGDREKDQLYKKIEEEYFGIQKETKAKPRSRSTKENDKPKNRENKEKPKEKEQEQEREKEREQEREKEREQEREKEQERKREKEQERKRIAKEAKEKEKQKQEKEKEKKQKEKEKEKKKSKTKKKSSPKKSTRREQSTQSLLATQFVVNETDTLREKVLDKLKEGIPIKFSNHLTRSELPIFLLSLPYAAQDFLEVFVNGEGKKKAVTLLNGDSWRELRSHQLPKETIVLFSPDYQKENRKIIENKEFLKYVENLSNDQKGKWQVQLLAFLFSLTFFESPSSVLEEIGSILPLWADIANAQLSNFQNLTLFKSTDSKKWILFVGEEQNMKTEEKWPTPHESKKYKTHPLSVWLFSLFRHHESQIFHLFLEEKYIDKENPTRKNPRENSASATPLVVCNTVLLECLTLEKKLCTFPNVYAHYMDPRDYTTKETTWMFWFSQVNNTIANQNNVFSELQRLFEQKKDDFFFVQKQQQLNEDHIFFAIVKEISETKIYKKLWEKLQVVPESQQILKLPQKLVHFVSEVSQLLTRDNSVSFQDWYESFKKNDEFSRINTPKSILNWTTWCSSIYVVTFFLLRMLRYMARNPSHIVISDSLYANLLVLFIKKKSTFIPEVETSIPRDTNKGIIDAKLFQPFYQSLWSPPEEQDQTIVKLKKRETRSSSQKQTTSEFERFKNKVFSFDHLQEKNIKNLKKMLTNFVKNLWNGYIDLYAKFQKEGTENTKKIKSKYFSKLDALWKTEMDFGIEKDSYESWRKSLINSQLGVTHLFHTANTWFGVVSSLTHLGFSHSSIKPIDVSLALFEKMKYPQPQPKCVFVCYEPEEYKHSTWKSGDIQKSVDSISFFFGPSNKPACQVFPLKNCQESIWFVGLTRKAGNDTVKEEQERNLMFQYFIYFFQQFYFSECEETEWKKLEDCTTDEDAQPIFEYFVTWFVFRFQFPKLATLDSPKIGIIFDPLFPSKF